MRESVGGFYLGVCVFMVGLVFTLEDLSCVYITVGGILNVIHSNVVFSFVMPSNGLLLLRLFIIIGPFHGF